MQTGYLVGNQCFNTEAEATNYKMSIVSPVITSDGYLMTPVYSGKYWVFEGERVSLTFPDCNNQDYFNEGVKVASIILVAMVVAYLIRTIIKMIYSMSESRGSNEE